MSKTLVIIPHYNKLILLKECLYHLQQQSYDDFDVLVVDNGSEDGSSEYISKLSNSDNNFHCILLSDNTGFAYAVNKGLRYSIDNGYKYSILLNNDAYVEDDFVKELVATIRSRDNYFAVSSMMINYHDKDLIDSYGDNYSILGWSMQGHVGEEVDSINYNEYCFSACAGAAIYRNAILEKIGLFDENFFAYLEDIDISYRAKLYGYSIGACFTARCYHLGSATSGSKYNEFKVRTSARNNIYLIYKNMPFVQILINIFPLFVGMVIKQVFFSMKGFGLDYFFGVFDGFKTLGRIKANDFKNINPFEFVKIEIELIINAFKYVINFLKRHSK